MIDRLIIIRGAGDLATGTAIKLHNAGFPLIMLDIEKPTVIRRTVSFAQALFDGRTVVEDVTAVRCSAEDALEKARKGLVAVVADPQGALIEKMHPDVVVDAIIAKKNLGTNKAMAPFTVALGPGFVAGVDVDAVIETKRGHTLGKIITKGSAIANTGIPGIIGGYGKERVMHSPCEGVFRSCRKIGDIVNAGDIVGYVGETPVKTKIAGKLRGILSDGLYVPVHFKLADVDPRGEQTDHTTVSDKARTIAGGVLEVVMNHFYGEFR